MKTGIRVLSEALKLTVVWNSLIGDLALYPPRDPFTIPPEWFNICDRFYPPDLFNICPV